jgi:glutathione peroxidase
VLALAVAATFPVTAGEKGTAKVPAALNFKMTTIDGKAVDLAKYRGKVVLIVNVASECGYTKQYKSLQALHAKYAKDGLAVLGIPCNDFGSQEPGTEKEIQAFCSKEYGVEFDLFAKVKILGKEPAPLYQFLQSKDTNPKHAGTVKWNFEKFLISRNGEVVGRFESAVNPEGAEFVSAIEAELKKKASK